MRALIATADVRAAASITVTLAKESLMCDTTDLGEAGLQMAMTYDYDIILLDLILADAKGYKMLQRLRAAPLRTPVLILSADDELDQKVKFLRCGADDFLTRPFDNCELTARIEAIVRRSRGHSESTIRTDKLKVNLGAHVVSVDDRPVQLSPKEYGILELLSLRKGTVLGKEAFLNHLYGGIDEPAAQIIDVYVCRLRKKLAQATGGSHYIQTQWGQGYVLREPAPMPAVELILGGDEIAARDQGAGARVVA